MYHVADSLFTIQRISVHRAFRNAFLKDQAAYELNSKRYVTPKAKGDIRF